MGIRVQLILSPSNLSSSYEVLSENMYPPLGILYLAGHLRKKVPNLEIKVTDGCKIGYDNTLSQIKAFKPDIVGISFLTTLAHGAFRLSKEINNLLPNTLLILGGAHATALPADTLEQSCADALVIGEGEEAFSELVNIVTANIGGSKSGILDKIGSINGVWTRKVHNPPADFVRNLDDIAHPAWDLIDLTKYQGWYLKKQSPEVQVLFSRGCPYNCTFCSNAVWKSSKPSLRVRSPHNIADELEYLSKHEGIREVFDQSDEFNNSIDNAVAICKELKRRNLGITWKTQLRAKPFSEELAKEMAEAGCWYVHLGIESGNEQTLSGVKKNIRFEDVENTCRLLKKYGIKVLALFMLYNVWEDDNGLLKFETHRMCLQTLKYANYLINKGLIDFIGWTVTTPYPGSDLYGIAKRHNLIGAKYLNNWEAWQKEGLFILDLPGINKRMQGGIKLLGEAVRLKCLIKNRDFKYKDMPFLAKRAVHVLKYSILPK